MYGLKIKHYLEENGIMQRYISEKTGIPENTLSMLLNGKRKLPVEEYFILCDVLGVPCDYFRDTA